MKKTSTIGIVLVLLCGGFQSATAGLLGMPLNLRAAIEQVDFDGSASPAIFRSRSGEFCTDENLTGPILVDNC
jgi:hypothetical protein